MKTIDHVATVLQCELDIWFRRQAANPFDRFYLYYLESTAEHDSGLFIGTEKPANPEFKLVMKESLNGFKTVAWNFNRAMESLNKLPILDI